MLKIEIYDVEKENAFMAAWKYVKEMYHRVF